MATQLNGKTPSARLQELDQFDEQTEVWCDLGTRAYLVGDDVEGNPDYNAEYIGTVAEYREDLRDLIGAR